MEGEPHAPLEVLCVIVQGGAVEASKDQVMILVVPRVPDIHIHEEMTVQPQDVVHPGPQLPPQPDHDPYYLVSATGASAQKKVLRNIC